MFQQGLKLLSGVVLCMIVCACMSKFDKNGSAYVVRPYIKDGYYTDGTFYYDIDKTDAIVIGTAKNERTLVIPDAVGINEVTYPLTKVQNLGVFNKETYETSQKVTNNDNLTSLTIGGNVKSFGKDVFFSEVIHLFTPLLISGKHSRQHHLLCTSHRFLQETPRQSFPRKRIPKIPCSAPNQKIQPNPHCPAQSPE